MIRQNKDKYTVSEDGKKRSTAINTSPTRLLGLELQAKQRKNAILLRNKRNQ